MAWLPPTHDLDTLRVTVGHEIEIRVQRMQLDLVHNRHDSRLFQQDIEQLLREVTDADGPALLGSLGVAAIDQLLHQLPRLDVRGGLVRHERLFPVGSQRARPVHEQDVDVVQPQLLQRPLQRRRRVVVHVPPELGHDGDVLARHATCADGLADDVLDAVQRGGVDEPVPGAQGVDDRVAQLGFVLGAVAALPGA